MQLKVYRRDNRKKDQRGRHRRTLRVVALLGLVLLAALLQWLTGPLAIVADYIETVIVRA